MQIIQKENLKLCNRCGKDLNPNNKSGFCVMCKSHSTFKLSKRFYSFNPENLPKNSWYKEVLEKQKGLPRLEDHIKAKREAVYGKN